MIDEHVFRCKSQLDGPSIDEFDVNHNVSIATESRRNSTSMSRNENHRYRPITTPPLFSPFDVAIPCSTRQTPKAIYRTLPMTEQTNMPQFKRAQLSNKVDRLLLQSLDVVAPKTSGISYRTSLTNHINDITNTIVVSKREKAG